MSNQNRISVISWFIFAICAIIWGLSFQMMKWGLESFSSYQLACVRIISAGLIFLPFMFREVKRVKPVDVFWIVLSAMISSFLPAFLFCIAEERVDGATASILNSFTPIWAFIIGIMFFRYRFTMQQLLGIMVGFLSVILIILTENEVKQSDISYSLLIILATLGYAVNVWIVSKKLSHVAAFSISTIGLSFNFVPAAIIFFGLTDVVGAYHQIHFSSSLVAGMFLGMIGTAVVGYLFFLLIKQSSAVFSSTVTYAIPAVGILVGLGVGESITIWQMIGIVGILVGIYLSRPRKKHS